MSKSIAELHRDYLAAHAAARETARHLTGTRVEWRPFGRDPEKPYVGTITRVDLGGVMVNWDDRSFWDGTKPHGLHPEDLRRISPGDSVRDVARTGGISTSTVQTWTKEKT